MRLFTARGLFMNQNHRELIPRVLEGEVISQRIKDGYVNATAMCKAAGALWGNYYQLQGTHAFLGELSADIGIPISELVQSVRGGFPELQGTWVHPHVAVNLATWLSPKFAVQVAKWVYEWMTEGAPRTRPELPYHLRRYLANYLNVPEGHFSILTELTQALIAPLEVFGYTLPEHLWPDISEGRMFAQWLRDECGIEPNDLPTYLHEYEDGRQPRYARAYPERLIGDFRRHFREVWLPLKAAAYFKVRDPKALEYLPRLLPKPH
jgi:KilA-N domain